MSFQERFIYEKFAPVELSNMDYNLNRIYDFARFDVTFRFSLREKATIHFTDKSGWMEHSDWKLAGTIEFRIDSRSIVKKVEFSCDKDHSIHEFDGTDLAPVEEDEKGTAKIYFTEMVGFRAKPRPFNFYEPGPKTDVCLITGDTKFYQKKQMLALHSPYFNTLFFGIFSEKNQDEVEIGDVTSFRFTYLLDAIHDSHLIDVFSLQCGEYVDCRRSLRCSNCDGASRAVPHPGPRMNKYQKLLLAEKYRLNNLQMKLFREWTDDDVIEISKGTDQYIKQLSVKMIGILMKKKKNSEN